MATVGVKGLIVAADRKRLHVRVIKMISAPVDSLIDLYRQNIRVCGSLVMSQLTTLI